VDGRQLLREIAATRIGLAPSPVHGLGVFALIDIPAGESDLFAPMTAEWPAVPLAEIEGLPSHARKLIDTYCLQDAGMAYLPPNGFKIIDLVVYLNHSDRPNLRQVDGGSSFVALRDIAAGEELFIDYGKLEVE
jgi:SET domain-containing protein